MNDALLSISGAALRDTLSASRLPIDDLDEGVVRYFALTEDGVAVAFGGIAGTGAERLLRSVVVPEPGRGRGRGARIVALLAEIAATNGTERLWLLTNDAADFFARLGWRKTARETAPDAIRATRQFSSLCPASATLMVRDLHP